MGEKHLTSIQDQWHIADGWLDDDPRFDGWYIVRGYDGQYAGPFTEDEAQRLLPEFQERYGETAQQGEG